MHLTPSNGAHCGSVAAMRVQVGSGNAVPTARKGPLAHNLGDSITEFIPGMARVAFDVLESAGSEAVVGFGEGAK